MSFHDDLAAATADDRAQLFTVPVITDCLAGRVTRAQYLAFLTEAYHHVSHTVPLLMSCGAALPAHKAWLRDAVAEYIEEERGHDQWILDDIAAAGGDAHAVRNGSPAAATELMVAYVYDYIARRNPVGFFGMVFVLEGTSVAIALRAADAIERTLRLPASALRYLRSHGEADRRHIRFFATLVARLDREEDRASVVHVAKMVYRLYADVFRGLPRATPVIAEEGGVSSEARRTHERAGRSPGAQRASASDCGGRHADTTTNANASEAAASNCESTPDSDAPTFTSPNCHKEEAP